MIGAIVGDIVGSRFEWHNIKTKRFDLFDPECHFTDDSVMSLAVCDALLAGEGDFENLSALAVRSMQKLGRDYPGYGYGLRFNQWLTSENPRPYGSWGNGAAMRVSGCGYVAKTIDEARSLSHAVTCVTHDHPEGLKGR